MLCQSSILTQVCNDVIQTLRVLDGSRHTLESHFHVPVPVRPRNADSCRELSRQEPACSASYVMTTCSSIDSISGVECFLAYRRAHKTLLHSSVFLFLSLYVYLDTLIPCCSGWKTNARSSPASPGGLAWIRIWMWMWMWMLVTQ